MKLELCENNKFSKNLPGDTGGRGGGGGGGGGGGVGWNLATAFSLRRSRISFFSISL